MTVVQTVVVVCLAPKLWVVAVGMGTTGRSRASFVADAMDDAPHTMAIAQMVVDRAAPMAPSIVAGEPAMAAVAGETQVVAGRAGMHWLTGRSVC